MQNLRQMSTYYDIPVTLCDEFSVCDLVFIWFGHFDFNVMCQWSYDPACPIVGILSFINFSFIHSIYGAVVANTLHDLATLTVDRLTLTRRLSRVALETNTSNLSIYMTMTASCLLIIIILYYAQSSTINHNKIQRWNKNTVILKYNNTVKYSKISYAQPRESRSMTKQMSPRFLVV